MINLIYVASTLPRHFYSNMNRMDKHIVNKLQKIKKNDNKVLEKHPYLI